MKYFSLTYLQYLKFHSLMKQMWSGLLEIDNTLCNVSLVTVCMNYDTRDIIAHF